MAVMSDLSFLYPLVLAAALFVLVVVAIVAVLRLSLARSIARSQPSAGPMPVVVSADDTTPMRAADAA